MKWLCAGLTFVNFATIGGLILGIVGRGLEEFSALTALFFGAFASVLAYLWTSDPKPKSGSPDSRQSEEAERLKASPRFWQRAAGSLLAAFTSKRYRHLWKWLVAACFALFALRSFLWLVYIDGDQLRIQSPNNLGDLALHITFIKNFANGVPLWPDNPIFVGSKLRYPAGTDLFNALLCLVHVDLIRGLVWAGLLGCLATFYAFYRWGGTFGVAGFLFNGGVAGYEFLRTWQFRDYQGVSNIAWKSIPLSMFLTQRGFLYAIPAGLLLLWHWREMYRGTAASEPAKKAGESSSEIVRPWIRGPLPFWVELSLYASMPLFHVHTFLALSGVLVFLFILGNGPLRWRVAFLIASALVPASLLVWLITDHFHAGSILSWHPGWVQNEGDFAAPFFQFWLNNFGLWVPLILLLFGWCAWRAWESGWRWGKRLPEDLAFLLPAAAIFVFAFFVKTAPWGWDNLKLMIWSYFLVLPFLWSRLIAHWSLPVRAAACVALFGSGFVTLFGGLAAGRPGFGLIDRAELDGVGHAIRNLSVEARFATYPTYNHPLLLQGRDVVLGYPGHLWTEGFEYGETFQQLNQLMQGAENWREIARRLHVRYIFWGPEEVMNYSESKRPWERTALLVTSGSWGAIYDAQKRSSSPIVH